MKLGTEPREVVTGGEATGVSGCGGAGAEGTRWGSGATGDSVGGFATGSGAGGATGSLHKYKSTGLL